MIYNDIVRHNMTEVNMEQKRLTLKEFAKEVKYSDRQISRYISSGKLFPRRNLSGRCYFLLEDVEKFNSFIAIDESSFLDLTASEKNNGKKQLS